ncbi:Acetyltransferase (GNAT) family protein [Cognatiyoonia koreensis]|uniref:Acetyltransferase (GNAT) family protein n=1 Tax=Cognatiyoonia koreensis TaxID=364200 RepID=A0A1I0RNU7_9RHOB|nr:GNAT family N-acetyltransferase [Cognatiyoonia koreensis]SEW42932.1 Acetyltransferase (GNAT) family protein [Cognatiyoonia koreensis]
MAVLLKAITSADIGPLSQINVREDQKDFIAPNPITIAQVRFEKGAYDFCIWDGETRVGLIAVIDICENDEPEEIDHPEAVYVWRLLIGAGFQGKGYGTAAIGQIEDWAAKRGRPLVQIQAVAENNAAIRLYEKLDYRRTGKMSDGEIQLEKWL